MSLLSGMFWAHALNPLIFDASGEFRTDGLFGVLSPVILQVSILLNLGWLLGLPPLLAGLAGLALFAPASTSSTSRPFARAALTVDAVTHLLIIAFSVQFLFVPAGASIRPMGWAMLMGLLDLVTLVIALPLSIVSVARERPPTIGAVAAFFSLTPFFFSSFVLHFSSWIKGFELSE
jgi:hypothetical protein